MLSRIDFDEHKDWIIAHYIMHNNLPTLVLSHHFNINFYAVLYTDIQKYNEP